MSAPQLVRGYEVVIGLENHVQLSTRSKIFSGSSTAFGAAPNTQASAVDLALPGTLPVLNRGAVERAIRFGLAVGAKVAPLSIFARKNYFYPDLPKGYQISQYEIPVVQGGSVSFFVNGGKKTVNLTRAHLEEDAGKSLHEDFHGMSGIDLNRAGTPLLEIVSEPELRSAVEACEYAKTLHALVMWLGICDGNMQEGSFRCDVNVSVRKPGEPFGTRREIKNLNSFKFLIQAVNFEVNWQIDRLEDGLSIQQATVLFNPDTGETRAMRSKEDAADYRYFPDPDLPPLLIGADWVERVKAELPELPAVMAARFVQQDGLPEYDAQMMTQSMPFACFYEAVRNRTGEPKLVANFLMGEVSARMNKAGIGIEQMQISPAVVAGLLKRVLDGTISKQAAKQVFESIWNAQRWTVVTDAVLTWQIEGPADVDYAAVDEAIESNGLKQMSDTGELERILDEVLAASPKSVEEFRAGKDKAFNALVGQAMKATKGKANPGLVNELLRKKLEG
ncbi:Asp-tRNA(Asn)/Glu-tRNA(Gln) amidotransferase subunit GatB [Inhella sp.]|uniref:Asp-tRNA(Asn)/Glu-tRNA(Gln) amidotransferase subunit GatB n=1 Tax=Inhella sp. TaxID=1921806 RepID=UPI0035AF1A0E